MSRERPIPFNGPMVRAILAGTKTQTRRLVKREHEPSPGLEWRDCLCREIDPSDTPCGVCAARFGPLYAEAGDTLWVREAWRMPAEIDALNGSGVAAQCLQAGYERPWAPIKYEADGTPNGEWRREFTPGRYRHARFMPRWASRLTLRVLEVRVERLQAITEEDARAEGAGVKHTIDCFGAARRVGSPCRCGAPKRARDVFARLWDAINGKRPGASWAADPWVWRVRFEREETS